MRRLPVPYRGSHPHVCLLYYFLGQFYQQASAGITCFSGTYAGSVKEPDFCFRPIGPNGSPRNFPSVILESGWASSRPAPVDDRRLWHEGSGGNIRVVIFVKLLKPKVGKKIRATLAISHCTPGTAAAAITTRIVNPLLSSISVSQALLY